jgi:hypothetical protein
LLAIQVVSRLRDAFAIDLSVESLFDAATVAGLATVVERLRGTEEGESDQMAELLDLVEGLSDDEVRAMLESRGAR